MGKRISQFPLIDVLTTDAVVPVVVDGVNYKFVLVDIKKFLQFSKNDIGLVKVDNTSDIDKPVSTAVSQELAQKANRSHTHFITEVEELSTQLENLATKNHTHDINDITGLNGQLISIAESISTIKELLKLLSDNQQIIEGNLINHTHSENQIIGLVNDIQTLDAELTVLNQW